MNSSRLLKILALIAALSIAGAIWQWRTSDELPDPWLIRTAIVALVGTLVMAVIDPITRPRLMLRFLAALFALATLMAVAADISRPTAGGEARGAISLMQHLQTFAPSLMSGLERSVSRSVGPYAWDPLLASILGMPASLIFLVLTIAAGWLGRPRRRVQIFINDY